MKHCNRCDKDKSLDQFNKRGDKVQPYCRDCQSDFHRAYYEANKTNRREQIRARQKVQIALNREYILSYLRSNPCIDCGDARIVVLEFDHVRGTKHLEVGTLAYQGVSIKKLQEEIDKCDVRCANCHTIVTAQRAGWDWKFE